MKIKKIMLGIGVICMSAIAGSIGACGIDKQEWEKQTRELLQEKYGEDFEILSVGKSYGNMGNATYTALCRPMLDEDCLFLTEADKDGEYFQDEYISTLISEKIENALDQGLEGVANDCYIHVAPGSKYVDSADTDMTLGEFLQMNPKNRFAVYAAVKGDSRQAEEIINRLNHVLAGMDKINGSLRLSFLDQDGVDAVRERMERQGVTDSGFMELLSHGEERTFDIREGRIQGV